MTENRRAWSGTGHQAVTGERWPDPAAQGLWIRTVGESCVSRDGVPISPTHVGDRKARTLLMFLATAAVVAGPTRAMSVDRIIPALWPDARPKRADDGVASLVSRLRSAIGKEAVLRGREGYRLGDLLTVDLCAAAETAGRAARHLREDRARAALATARSAWTLIDEAIVLADFPDVEWVRPARAFHGVLRRQVRHLIGHAASVTGDLAAAVTAAEAAVRDDPLDEEAHRILMSAQDAGGDPARSLNTYHRLRAALAEAGTEPESRTSDLYTNILRRGAAHVGGPTRAITGAA
jgi:DNA-binding SARP family transcriptional activator